MPIAFEIYGWLGVLTYSAIMFWRLGVRGDIPNTTLLRVWLGAVGAVIFWPLLMIWFLGFEKGEFK